MRNEPIPSQDAGFSAQYQSGELTPKQRQRLATVYYALWFIMLFAVLFLGRWAMVAHLALPWIAIATVVRYPGDFALSMSRRDARMSLVYPWFLTVLNIAAPPFVSFIGGGEFLSNGCFLGAALGVAVVLVEPRRIIARLALPLALSLLYGYGAVREMDVIFDQSGASVYQAKVIEVHGGKGQTLVVAPWGPVSEVKRVSVTMRVYLPTKEGDTICMVLRQGALGVPWYSAQTCPWKGGAVGLGP